MQERLKKGKKHIKYCPIFRPVDIQVIGIDKEHRFEHLEIAHPSDCGGTNPQGDNAIMRIYVYLR